MGAFILILFTSYRGIFVTQEFSSEARCRHAGEQAIQMPQAIRNGASFLCVAK